MYSLYERMKKQLAVLQQALTGTPAQLSRSGRNEILQYVRGVIHGNQIFALELSESQRLLIDKMVFAPDSIELEDFQSEALPDDIILETLYCAALGAGLCRMEIFDACMTQCCSDET